jgi:regulation of enolase protein 1 (concanavalin A-like superfamily)
LRLTHLTLLLVASLASAVVSSEEGDQDAAIWTTSSIGPASAQSQSVPCLHAPASCPVVVTTALGSTNVQQDTAGFVNRLLVGNGFVKVNVTDVLGAPTALAGVAIRESVKPGAAYVAVLRSSGGAFLVRRRTQSGGAVSQSSLPPQASKPTWMRIERAGQKVTVSLSGDGTAWSAAWSGSFSFSDTTVTGPIVTSQRPDAFATAVFASLSLESAPALPAGWSVANIGTVSSLSQLQGTNGIWAFSHWGTGAAGVDDVAFAFKRVTGDADIALRLQAANGETTLTGLMVRRTLDVASPFLWLRGDPTGQLSLRRRQAAGSGVLSSSLKKTAYPRWLRLVRQGDALSVYDSADGQQWALLSTQMIDLATDAYVGLAVARGASLIGVGLVDQWSLGAQGTANLPPTISLTAPISGASVVEGDGLAINATASDADDHVQSVEFFVDGTRVGVDTAAPYAASWVAAGVGVHTIKANALDSDGAVASTGTVSVNVLASADGRDGEDTDGGGAIPVPPPSGNGPWILKFNPSPDHSTLVDRYIAEVYSTTNWDLMLARDLGRPAVVAGDCTVDLTQPISALPPGLYQIVVRAVDDSTGNKSFGATAFFNR